ncbi:MAG: hypothetical protein FWE91_03120 [Defluviitaleaceae bacterium]|nr:hypothetical protein [Defluviitaleaceae bacterium]MCL2835904.1 hypothetical protein [Defluviitaleaceae bacterium]
MDLFKEILVEILMKENINIIFPNLKYNMTDIVEMKAYKTLQKIKNIIENDGFSDFECIEEIVCVFERIGSGGGNRHDFY